MHFGSLETFFNFSKTFGFWQPRPDVRRPPAPFARENLKFTIGAKKNIISKIRNGEASLFGALFQMKQ